MDLYGVSIGVQEVLFYLIKVYELKFMKCKGERLC